MKKLLVASAIALLGSAHAADSGFYLTAGLGLSVNDYKQEDATQLARTLLNAGYSSAEVKLEKRAGAGKVGLGYQFNSFVAVDVAYMNLGTFEHKLKTTGPSGTGTVEDKFYGTAVSIIGSLPTSEKNSVFVKVGSLSLKNEAEARFCVATTCSFSRLDQKTTVPLFGIGTSTEYGEHWGLTGEWNHTRIKYDDGSTQRLNLFLISGRFKF